MGVAGTWFRSGVVFLGITSCGLLEEEELRRPADRQTWLAELLAAEDARDGENPLFQLALEEQDPVVRKLALRALGRIGDPRTISMILEATRNETDRDTRLEGIFAIGLTRHSTVVEAAESFILSGDPVIRAAVAQALGLAGDDRGLVTLLDAMDDAAPEVRGAGALALARIFAAREQPIRKRSFGSFQIIGERMRNDVSSEVRWRCAYAASRLRRKEMKPYLLDAMHDEEPLVRRYACAGLAVLPQDPASRTALLDALADQDWLVVVEAAKALAQAPSTESMLGLAALLSGGGRGHPSLHVRAAAARSLGSFTTTRGVVSILTAALSDPSESVRGEALEALGEVVAPPDPEQAADSGEPASQQQRDAVARLLLEIVAGRSPAPANRYFLGRAARAAEKIGGDRGAEVIRRLIQHEDPAVRSAALAAAGGLGDAGREFAGALEQALGERDVGLRDYAARSVAALDLKMLGPALERALVDSPGAEYIEARVSLLRALGGVWGQQAVPRLRASLHDPERAVRQAARDELARLGGSIPRLPPPTLPERLVTPRPGVDFLTGEPNPVVRIVTAKGPFSIELLRDEAPNHVTAFLSRCRSGFYDGLSMHRMVPGFVIQGLDPRGDGYGTGELSLRGEVNRVRYERGTVGMPDAGPDTGGCQLFVTFAPEPRLDARYTAFARVVDGMEVLEQLDQGDRVDYVVAPPVE